LEAYGTTYRHCGFDQPLSSNSRCQNRVAAPTVPELATWTMIILGFAGIGFMAYRRKSKPMCSASPDVNMIVHPQVRAFLLQRELDFAAVLKGLTVPVLVTHGRSDIVALPAMGDHILQQCKTAEPSWYDGIGHAPFLEEPQRFNRELARFAARAHGT